MLVAVALRDQGFHGRRQQFLARIAEQPLRFLVRQVDPAAPIDHHHRDRGHFNRRPEDPFQLFALRHLGSQALVDCQFAG
jgi:hypothetical protein